jgi:hypothetical protein
MLLESAEALFERVEHRFRQLRCLARLKHVLKHNALAKDMGLQFGDVPIGLGKMFPFLSHGFEPTTKKPGKRNLRKLFFWLSARRYSALPRVRYRLRFGVAQ